MMMLIMIMMTMMIIIIIIIIVIATSLRSPALNSGGQAPTASIALLKAAWRRDIFKQLCNTSPPHGVLRRASCKRALPLPPRGFQEYC